MKTDSEKALRLVTRYAILQTRVTQCKWLMSRLFDECEKTVSISDEAESSGCISRFREAKKNGELRYGPDGESNFDELIRQIGFCPYCQLGMKVGWHRKRRLMKRRTAVLGAIKRLGSKQRKVTA